MFISPHEEKQPFPHCNEGDIWYKEKLGNEELDGAVQYYMLASGLFMLELFK